MIFYLFHSYAVRFLLLFLLFLSTSANAERTVIEIENKNFQIPLPAKFCDFSSTVWGIQVMDFLKQHQKNSSIRVEPRIVYKLCNSSDNQIFPWGYLGVSKKDNFIKNQKHYNKFLAKVLDEEDVFENLVKKETKGLSNFLDEYGVDLKNTSYNKPFIVWFDEDIIITSIISSHLVDNEQYNEKLITSATIIDDIIFSYTTYDDKGELGIDTKSFALDLITNAKILKQNN